MPVGWSHVLKRAGHTHNGRVKRYVLIYMSTPRFPFLITSVLHGYTSDGMFADIPIDLLAWLGTADELSCSIDEVAAFIIQYIWLSMHIHAGIVLLSRTCLGESM
jgi:hypothetical protein